MALRTSLTLLAVLSLSVWCPTAGAVSINFVPGSQSSPVGDPLNVDIVISDLGDGLAPSLGNFDLDVSFNPAILSPTDVTFGSFLGDPDPFLFETIAGFDITSTPGVVDLFLVSLLFEFELDALQPDSFTLATISFTGMAPGTTTLDFTQVILGDAFGNPLFASTGVGAVEVVPEPSTLLLMSSAAGLGLIRRVYRRKTGRCVAAKKSDP